jgi:hypothetical protein
MICQREGFEIDTDEFSVCALIDHGAPIRKEEDAELIVRAVNAHDYLVAALEAMLKTYRDIAFRMSQLNDQTPDEFVREIAGVPAYVLAEAALAKARGEK